MDDQRRQRSWRLTRRQILWTVGIIAVLVGAYAFLRFAYVREWKWTGLVKNPDYHKRTLWDWLDLLIVPTVLAIGGYLFTRSENRATREAAERRTQDEALQAYLDHMSDMLIPSDNLPSLQRVNSGDSLGESLLSVARARTLTVLSRLDGDRKARVVQFLYESDLVNELHPIISLRGASLSGASLSRTNLRGANLRWAYLFEANLFEARGWTEEQLAHAESLEGVTMPDGQILRSDDNPVGPTFEKWINNQDRGEAEENSSRS